MIGAVVASVPQTRPEGRVLSARNIEHMLDWAEPTIRRTCRDVWQRTKPRGLELEDLCQEGRIAVFLAADEISTARQPQSLVSTIVRRQAYDALRLHADKRSNEDVLTGVEPPTAGDDTLCEVQLVA